MTQSWKIVLKSASMTIAVILVVVLVILFTLFLMLVFLVRSSGLADCGWHGATVSYLDLNQNSRFDSGETALPGVPVYVNDLYNHLSKMSPAVTDEQGMAHLDLFIAGCPTVDLQVQVDVPNGYRATSPSQVHVKKDFFGVLETDATYYFGFARLP